MPKIINMKSVRECSKSFRRPVPPQGNPGGPLPPISSTSRAPPTVSPSGPPLSTSPSPTSPLSTSSSATSPTSTSSSATPPPPTGGAPPPGEEGEEFGEKDVGEPVETLGDAQNSSTSGKIQHKRDGRAHRGKYWAIMSFDIPYLLKYKTSPTTACFPHSSIGRKIPTHNEFDFVHNCMVR